MNRKQLTLLIVFGVVVSGLGWLAYQKQKATDQESTDKMGALLWQGFPINDVAKLTIRQGTNDLTLLKKDETWTVQERSGYPANFNNISDFLRKIWELKIAKPVKVGPPRLPQLELTEPPKGAGTLVNFQGKDGKSLRTLLLGAKHQREAREDSQFGGGAYPDGRYVMLGNDIQTVALVSDAFASIEPRAAEWLNKDFFKVEKLKSVTVTTTNATNNWKLSRETESGEWKLADVKGDEKLDTGKSSGVTSAFSSPSFNDVAGAEKTDDLPITGVLETFEGFKYTIQLGKKGEGDDYLMHVSVTSNFPTERPAVKDEKPEDKVKHDKEFADNRKKLEEKLKADQPYSKWNYIVAKWTVDSLLKDRKDLLADKKVEKKEDAKPDPKLDDTK